MITQNIIGFALSGESGRTISSFNPSTMQSTEAKFFVATEEDVNQAMNKAYMAWRIYRSMPGKSRANFLRTIADEIEKTGPLLIQTIQEETAYPEARIITERTRTLAQLRMFADYIEQDNWKEIIIDEALPNRSPAPRPRLKRVMMPIGPVVVFGASNFPLAYSTMGGDSVSALAAGCPVVIKAHESHLCTNALVAEAIMKAAIETGMPDGVFSSLNGDGMSTGKQLVLHPHTAAVGFTGSFGGGKALFDLGNSREKPIPVFAEMGSVNPIFIFQKTIRDDLKNLTSKLVSSMTMTAGQFCTNPGIIVIQKSEEADLLINELKSELEKIGEVPMLNPNVAKNYHKGLNEVRQDTSVEIVTNRNTEGQSASPVLTKVAAAHFLKNPKLHHEIFGPYSIIVLCEDSNEILSIAEALEGQLTASVFATQEEQLHSGALFEVLTEKAGRIILNGVPTGVEVCAAMTHGGPFPASTDSRFTAVGHHAIKRWLRPVTFQNMEEDWLPAIYRS